MISQNLRPARLAIALLALSAVPAAADWRADLAAAKPGTTVAVPAGTFAGAVEVPPGVTLRGAGIGATVIEARGAAAAVRLRPGKGTRVEDLAVRGDGIGISADGADDVLLARLLVTGGTIGIQLTGSSGGRVENCIVAGTQVGVALQAVAAAAVANCTVADAAICGLTVSGARDTAVFNELVVDAGTAVTVGGANRGLAIDHNLYIASTIGKIEGQCIRPSLPAWRDVSGGLDARSVQLPVGFANRALGDYRPVSTLAWSPGRPATAGWGAAELGGHRAPAADADGAPRGTPPGVGAYEAPPPAAPPPDGWLEIASDAGVKSAGLFSPGGRLVNYLFHGLPLGQGRHPYALPARDVFGRPIPPGNYELRVAEGDLTWSYRGMAFNRGAENTPDASASVHVIFLAFTDGGDLLEASTWSERHISLRAIDRAGRTRWTFGGSNDTAGVGVGADGNIHLARIDGDGAYSFYRIDPATGRAIARKDGSLYAPVKLGSKRLGGICELGGKLYAAVIDAGEVRFGPADTLEFREAARVPDPFSPAADRKRNLVWAVSGRDKVVALAPDGRVAHEFTGVRMPLALAVAGDRLAVASGDTGKVHFFRIGDPARPEPDGTIGRGDGPFGPWLPDRFHFQAHSRAPRPGHVHLALAGDGGLAVRDASSRVVVFGAGRKPTRDGIATWGGDAASGPRAGDRRIRSFEGSASVLLDPGTGRWEPEAYWARPPLENPELRGLFEIGGRGFILYTGGNPAKKGDVWTLIASTDDSVMKTVLVFRRGEGGACRAVRDENGDGVVDERDGAGEPVLDGEGKPFALPLAGRFLYVKPDGTFWHADTATAVIARPRGLDGRGAPAYDFRDAHFRAKDSAVPSPYDFDRTEDLAGASSTEVLPGGGLLAAVCLRSSPKGMGFSNSGATDLVRWAADGSFRWFRALNDYSPIQRVETVGPITWSSWGHQAEFMAMDEDGLELGRLGFPPAANWNGFWVDHPQEWFVAPGEGGEAHIVVGDYVTNCHHWFTVKGAAGVRRSKVDIAISAEKARELTFRKPAPYPRLAEARPPEVTIKRLPGPMAIDGDPAKWRRLGFAPQVLFTPLTAFGRIDGPRDLSGVAWLGYTGRDLYGMAIVFDDTITFHQPAARFYKGDSLQFCIDGFLSGFGFSLARTTDKGAMFFRNRFYFGNMDLHLDPALAPRVIRVLPDGAAGVPERRTIESICGVDLAKSPAYAVEFKLPLDATTYKGDERIVPAVEPGKKFWLGFMLNDNDTPGADLQEGIAWPGTFGMFAAPEAGARAVFE